MEATSKVSSKDSNNSITNERKRNVIHNQLKDDEYSVFSAGSTVKASNGIKVSEAKVEYLQEKYPLYIGEKTQDD
jgi:hypothetical protein